MIALIAIVAGSVLIGHTVYVIRRDRALLKKEEAIKKRIRERGDDI